MVDENRVEGAAKTIGGKVQGAVGGMMGDAGVQAKGKLNQAAGSAQDAFGLVMDSASGWGGNVADMAKEKPVTALLVALSLGFVLRALTHTSRR